MLKVHVDSEIALDLDDVLEGASNLDLVELEELADKIIALRAERRIPSIPQGEAVLIEKINQGVPVEARKQYDILTQKLLDEIITPDEHQEYLILVEQIKMADAERMRHLMALAELRNSTVDVEMDKLGLRQPTYA